mgnify:CR=1 FL=1
MASLKQKAYSGVVWSTVQRIVGMGVTFVSNVVLARILSPEDFGCIAILMVFITLSNTFIDGGFGSALIQKKEPTQVDYSTIFYWNLALSVVIYALLFVCAPLVARFYKIGILETILRVQGLILIFNAFNIIQQNQLKKQLQFKKLAIANILAATISLLVAIFTAVSGWGVWSLVAQQLSMSLLVSIFVFIATRWKPLLVFSFQSFNELFKFGGYMLLSNLFSSVSNEISSLLVGRMFTPDALGLINQARRLEGTAATTASSVIDQVTYPVMASLQDNRPRLQTALKKFIQVPAFVCCLLMTVLIIAAKPIIILLFTEKWVDCVPYFQIMCVAGVAVCLQSSANYAIAAVGRSDVFFKWTIIKRTLIIVLSIVGILTAGIYGMLWCDVIGTWAVYVINAYLVSKHVGYSIWNQIKDILPSIILSVVIGIIVNFLTSYLSLNMHLTAVIQILLITSLYLLAFQLLGFESLAFIENTIKERFVEK